MKKFIMLLFVTISISGQQLPQHIDLPELGLSFDLPDGWSGQLDGEMLVLGHQTIPGLMVVYKNESTTAQELKELAMQGIAMEGVALNPIEDFVVKNELRVDGMYQGTFNGAKVKGYAIGLINKFGIGINILILTETDKFTDQHLKEANTLVSSVKFKQSKDTPATMHWKNKIVGKQLMYLSTQSNSDYTGGTTGTSTRKNMDLCTDGSFQYYANIHNSYSSGNSNAEAGSTNEQNGFGSSNSQSNTSGIYKIYSLGNQTFLELSFEGGEIVEYELSENDEGYTFLEGTRYFIAQSKICN